jgi:hypothetical protein
MANPKQVVEQKSRSARDTESMPPIVFTPDDEPYLGRPLVHAFDQLICAVMEANAAVAPTTHAKALTDTQAMACQVIAQSLSIALSIRELIRQGYLFGGHVLLRALVERAVILLYIHHYPSEIGKWNRGWEIREAPSLSKMFDQLQSKLKHSPGVRGSELTASMNSLLHSKPDSARWNLVRLGEGRVGHAVSKLLDHPELCDELCGQAVPWLAVVAGMMQAYFPRQEN